MISEMENLLEFDELLKPKLNSSQHATDDLEGDKGRPELDDKDKTDGTVVGDGYK